MTKNLFNASHLDIHTCIYMHKQENLLGGGRKIVWPKTRAGIVAGLPRIKILVTWWFLVLISLWFFTSCFKTVLSIGYPGLSELLKLHNYNLPKSPSLGWRPCLMLWLGMYSLEHALRLYQNRLSGGRANVDRISNDTRTFRMFK